MTEPLILSLIWFAIFLVGHLVYFNINPHVKRAEFITRLLGVTLIGESISIIILIKNSMGLSLLWGWLMTFCLFVLYMPFYYVIATSLSIQSMILLKIKGQYPLNQLQEAFVSKALVEGRLSTMVTNGYLIEMNKQYRLTPKGKKVAGVFIFLKNLWKLGSGG